MSALSLPCEATLSRPTERSTEAEFQRKWGAPEREYLDSFGVSPEEVMHGRQEYPLERFGSDLKRKIAEWVDLDPETFRGLDSELLSRAALAVVVCEAHDLGFFSFHQIFPSLNGQFYELCKNKLCLHSNLLTAYYVGWAYRGTTYGLSARDSMEQVYTHMGQILRRMNFPEEP